MKNIENIDELKYLVDEDLMNYYFDKAATAELLGSKELSIGPLARAREIERSLLDRKNKNMNIDEFANRLNREFGVELNFAYNEKINGFQQVSFNDFSKIDPDKYDAIQTIKFEFKDINDFFYDYNVKQQIKEIKEYDRLYTYLKCSPEYNIYELNIVSMKNKEPEPKVKITIQ